MSRVVAARVVATLDPEGIDFDRDVEARPVDDSGQIVAGVELDPRTVHVTIPLFTNRQSRTLPGQPGRDRDAGPGVPHRVGRRGPARRVRRGRRRPAGRADVGRHGAGVGLGRHARRLRPGPAGPAVGRGRGRARRRCRCRSTIEALTETRTYSAGIRLDGREPGLDYAVSASQVLLTLFGPVADLDRLGSAPIVVGGQRRGARAGQPRAAGGPIVALDPDPRGGVAGDRDRHDRRAGDPGAGGFGRRPEPGRPRRRRRRRRHPDPRRTDPSREDPDDPPVRHGRHSRRGQRRSPPIARVRARAGDRPPGGRRGRLARRGPGHPPFGRHVRGRDHRRRDEHGRGRPRRSGSCPRRRSRSSPATGEFAAGIMVSASHNPAEDNGLKVLDPRGPQARTTTSRTSSRPLVLRADELPGVPPDGDRAGRRRGGAPRALRRPPARARGDRRRGGLHVVLDTANGAAYRGRRREILRATGRGSP